MTKLAERGWDVPGGHIDPGESPKEAVIREIYEETATHVQNLRIFAHEKFVLNGSMPDGYKYPYPISYQVFFLGQVASFDPFVPTDEATERKLLTPDEARQTNWGNRGSLLFDAAVTEVTRTKN